MLPFALNNVKTIATRFLHVAPRAANLVAAAAMSAMLATDVVMHLRGHIPESIVSVVDPGQVYSDYPNVKAASVRFLIDRYLGPNSGSVMAQFFTVSFIRERPGLYFTGYDKDNFLSGALRPDYVLLDLGAADPHTPTAQERAIASILREGRIYEAISDANGVLLYRRR